MTTYMHPDDRPSEHDGLLWDAGDVCCAAFQLGACEHTESYDEYDDVGRVDTCPDHCGEHLVVRSYASAGSDPYDVSVLTCGCHVVCFGPGEPNVVLRRTQR